MDEISRQDNLPVLRVLGWVLFAAIATSVLLVTTLTPIPDESADPDNDGIHAGKLCLVSCWRSVGSVRWLALHSPGRAPKYAIDWALGRIFAGFGVFSPALVSLCVRCSKEAHSCQDGPGGVFCPSWPVVVWARGVHVRVSMAMGVARMGPRSSGAYSRLATVLDRACGKVCIVA